MKAPTKKYRNQADRKDVFEFPIVISDIQKTVSKVTGDLAQNEDGALIGLKVMYM
jgi:hypothetical protein